MSSLYAGDMFEDLEDAFSVEEFLSGSASNVAGSSSSPGATKTTEVPLPPPVLPEPGRTSRAQHHIGTHDNIEVDNLVCVRDSSVQAPPISAPLPTGMTTRKRWVLTAPSDPPSKRQDSRSFPFAK